LTAQPFSKTTTKHNTSNLTPKTNMASTTTVPKHLNFITGNKNKLAEVQAILEGVIELRNQNVDLVEIQGTVEEVTADKARRAAEAVSQPT
jgi:inosine triphosphate pyrophosphatase